MRRATAEITREIMAEYQPGVWDAMPAPVRALVIARAQAETPRMVREVLAGIQQDVDAVFDLKRHGDHEPGHRQARC